MFSTNSIEQQHQELKRQISAHDTYPCFLLDQSFQQKYSSPMNSFVSAQSFSASSRTPTNRTSNKTNQQYRLFPSSPSNNLNSTRVVSTTQQRSTVQLVDVPIEKTIVPLRTMTDLFPSFSYTTMKIKSKTYSNSKNLTKTNPSINNNLTVSIFAFRDEDFEMIRRIFQEIGPTDSLRRGSPSTNENILHVTYRTNVSCQNALSRDGMIVNGHMIGVVRSLENSTI